MDTVAHENSKNNKPTNGKKTPSWKLSDKERTERRKTADELSQHNARDRDRLKSTLARAAEVKELIKATDLGKELEELKDEAKFLEGSIDSRGETIERCLREAQTGETDRQQESLPGVPPAADKAPKAPPPKPSAAERTVPLLPEWSGPAAGEAEVHPGGELAPEAPRPPAPPMVREETDFKDLGPTRKPLTNWLHQRLLWAGEAGVSWDKLTDEIEASPFFCDELGAAADLLVAVGLARKVGRPAERKDFRGRTRTVFTYFGQVDEHGRSVDEAVLDEIAGTLADGPQRLDELAPSLSVPQWALLDVLDELHQAGRARRLNDGSWDRMEPFEVLAVEDSTDRAVREVLAKGPGRLVTEVASCLGWDAVGTDPEAQRTYRMVLESLSRVAVRDGEVWRLLPQAEAAE